MESYSRLLGRIADISHLNTTIALLDWDQQCYMPTGGAGERSEQIALISRLAHQTMTADETAALIDKADTETSGLPDTSDERLTLRVVRRDFDLASKLPTSLVEEMAKATTLAHEVWVTARAESNYAHFAPTLSHLLDLSRQVAGHFGWKDTLYDALLDQYEPGMKTAQVQSMFTELRSGLVPLVQAIAQSKPLDDSVLRRDYDIEKQRAFGRRVVQRLGYDFERGRQDEAVHPFCTSFGRNDVRITTRYDKNWLPSALMGSIHETGHALYELGFAPGDDNTPLSSATSLSFHESQSRLWENVVGRSRAFWNVFFPDLRATFPETLSDVDVDTFYRAINKVSPSLIRVEADEVTYGLHIMVRFELEQELLNETLAVKDLPDAWNAKYQEYLGITPPNDAEGCLQDIHWSGASFGYFPTYALGSMLASQLYDKAISDNPQILSDLEAGEYASLLHWLGKNVHQPGRRYYSAELVERICGTGMSSAPYLRYLNGKFGALYGLN